ncbi:MAG: heme peroxidase family protein [Actinomycetota bacterium]|nr:heme peroxidase family protein [Actinomycetota bacterium]
MQADADPFDNPAIPAGYTYLGQFIDHDITFDPASSLQRQNDPDALRDFRTPRFDLDSVYGAGPDDAPFLYQREDKTKLLIGTGPDGEPDLPRNVQDRALIGDPRNDENTIVSQLQLLFIRFHNRVVDELVKDGWPAHSSTTFEEAQRVVRWHYQWIVVHDFLERMVHPAIIADIFDNEPVIVDDAPEPQSRRKINLLFFHWHKDPFMPIEFSVAAYRFGHSMIRPDYFLNGSLGTEFPIFTADPNPQPTADLRGFKARPAGWTIDWSFFFELGGDGLQHAHGIDSKLAAPLQTIPDADPPALALRNLQRGVALGLPSGQRVARAMGLEPLTDAQLGLIEISEEFRQGAPLWFYILKEAEVRETGVRLGPVGGRIVAEVLCGLLKGDPLSYINVEPNWTPRGLTGIDGNVTMPDLIRFVQA